MRFYVPVGPRGALLRVGMVLNSVTGGLVYWQASRRRSAIAAEPSSQLEPSWTTHAHGPHFRSARTPVR